MADVYDQEQVISEGDQDSPPSTQDYQAGVRAMQKQREASRNERTRSMEKHPRCALLSSPEKLDEWYDSRGSDETDTLKDFELVKDWVKKKKFLNAQLYPTIEEIRDGLMPQLKTSRSEPGERKGQEEAISGEVQDSPLSEQKPEASDNEKQSHSLPSPEKLNTAMDVPGSDVTGTPRDFERVKEDEQLEPGEFGSNVQLAFKTAFDTMRNTASPELEELAVWYYAGHGLGKETAQKLRYSSTPCLKELVANNNDAANEFVKENRKVQGGELCLHKFGFCDLYGLLKPWIAAIKAETSDATCKGAKKNKHLVIILDSCHSGIIAKELNDFQKQAQKIDSTLLDGNSVTIQAACGPEERTYGGYFTPCFVYLNENVEFLNKLKYEWKNMEEEQKAKYRSSLPSPMVATTRHQSRDVTMEMEVQNFRLILFQDPGFFKFCSIKVCQHQDKELFEGKERVLDATSATTFMTTTTNFTVLDYKLKTIKTAGIHAGTPMGLFLLEDPSNPSMTVCAHIHFRKRNTKSYTRINLVHHKKPLMGSTCGLHEEDHDGLSAAQVVRSQHKIPIPLDGNAKILVQACYQYVKSREPGRWGNATRWNMTGSQFGVNGMFRLACQQERSAWEDSYLEYIKEFNLPKVPVN